MSGGGEGEKRMKKKERIFPVISFSSLCHSLKKEGLQKRAEKNDAREEIFGEKGEERETKRVKKGRKRHVSLPPLGMYCHHHSLDPLNNFFILSFRRNLFHSLPFFNHLFCFLFSSPSPLVSKRERGREIQRERERISPFFKQTFFTALIFFMSQ